MNSLTVLKPLVKEVYVSAIKRKYDCWWAWFGMEGNGKSMGLLWAIDEYCRIARIPKSIDRIAQNRADIGVAFGDSKEEEPIGFDEAIELDSRRSMDDLNVVMGKATMICRADRNFVNIAVPDILAVDKRVRRKIMVLAYMAQRGVAFYWIGPRAVRRTFYAIEKTGDPLLFKEEEWDEFGNYTPPIYNMPDAADNIPDYQGNLRKLYDAKKMDNVKQAKQEVKRVAEGIKNGRKEAKHIDEAQRIKNTVLGYTAQVREFKKATGKSETTYRRYIR